MIFWVRLCNQGLELVRMREKRSKGVGCFDEEDDEGEFSDGSW